MGNVALCFTKAICSVFGWRQKGQETNGQWKATRTFLPRAAGHLNPFRMVVFTLPLYEAGWEAESVSPIEAKKPDA